MSRTPLAAPPRPRRRFRPDGSLIFEHHGGRHPLRDLYHFLRSTRWLILLGAIAGFFLLANALFAGLYLAAGHLSPEGSCIRGATPGSFADALFFSVQTMSTIGYGGMVPRGTFANVLVTVEALFGLLLTAMSTGLIFAKFATPTAQLIFSSVALIRPLEGQRVLTFRIGNRRPNQIIEAQVRLTLLRRTVIDGEELYRFFDLPLLRDVSPVFSMTWSVFHVIDEESPLAGLASAEDFAAADATLMVTFRGIDGSIAQAVHARYAYEPTELLCNRRFVDVVSTNPKTGLRVFELARFHETEPLAPAPGETHEPAGQR